MRGQDKHIFGLTNSKTFRSLAISMLVILCLLSSCSIRKSVLLLFSDHSIPSLVLNKGIKSGLVSRSGLEYKLVECGSIGQGLDDLQLSVRQAVTSPFSMLPFLVFVLPEFLLSLLKGVKAPTVLPVPNSRLRWSYLPLFLQNRLLLI